MYSDFRKKEKLRMFIFQQRDEVHSIFRGTKGIGKYMNVLKNFIMPYDSMLFPTQKNQDQHMGFKLTHRWLMSISGLPTTIWAIHL